MNTLFTPNGGSSRNQRKAIVGMWLVVVAVFWLFYPSVFLPSPSEVMSSLHDLWMYQDLASSLLTSFWLNVEAIISASGISLLLAYSGTIPILSPMIEAIGKLRFLSLAGLGFAFTLMTSSGHALKVSVLVFMVVVFFVVSMVDIISAIPREQYDLAKTMHMGPWEVLYEVVILGQADQAFVVLRQTAAMSWMFLSTAEAMSMSGGGVGSLLITASKHSSFAEIMALQLLILGIGIGQDYAIGWLRTACCPWIGGRG